MQPALTGKRRFDERSQHRLDEAGHRRLFRILDRGGIDTTLAWDRLRAGLPCRPGQSSRRFLRLVRRCDSARLRRPARRLKRHFVDRAAGRGRLRLLLEDIRRALRPRIFIVALDKEPVVVLLARVPAHPDEMPSAFELLSMELEVEVALGEALMRVADRRPGAAIPDKHRAPAVFALGDRAFERAVVERMVLDRDRKTLFPGDEARAARHRPALQHAVHFETEIVMEPPRVVLLHDEAVAPASLSARLSASAPASRRNCVWRGIARAPWR